MPGKYKIEKQVRRYFRYLVRKVRRIISRVNINALKFKIINRLGLKVMRIDSAMKELNNQIQLKLKSIQGNYEQFEKSCVEECNKKRRGCYC